MEKRPPFSAIKSYAEFAKYYWYREELQAVCKQLGLEYNANKTVLNQIIKAYFAGEKIVHHAPQRTKVTVTELDLQTPLLSCGFTFGEKFRQFYRTQTHDAHFKFTADMVATVKAVKQNQDQQFTLGDLLDIKTGKKEYVKFDNSACQWNKFLKDFCADPHNNGYQDKLKTASKFWALLRQSELPKVYTPAFVKNYQNLVDT